MANLEVTHLKHLTMKSIIKPSMVEQGIDFVVKRTLALASLPVTDTLYVGRWPNRAPG
jgi:hypothetical protein